MLKPFHISVDSVEALPLLEEVILLAQMHLWLVIDVPTTVTFGDRYQHTDPAESIRKLLIDELIIRLPTHRVWDGYFSADKPSLMPFVRRAAGTVVAGSVPINIRVTVSETVLEENLKLLVRACSTYRGLTNSLMPRLARQLRANLSEFTESESWHRYEQTGRFDAVSEDPRSDTWSYFFHGVDCGFTNVATGVHVEAPLGFGLNCGDDFGIFITGFFLNFLSTIALSDLALLPLVYLLCGWSGDILTAFEFMERRGLLRRVGSANKISRGWAFVEPNMINAEATKSSRTIQS